MPVEEGFPERSTWFPCEVVDWALCPPIRLIWQWLLFGCGKSTGTGKSQEVQGVLQFTSATLSKCVPWLGPQVALSRASQAVLRHSLDGESVGKSTSSEPSVAAIFFFFT